MFFFFNLNHLHIGWNNTLVPKLAVQITVSTFIIIMMAKCAILDIISTHWLPSEWPACPAAIPVRQRYVCQQKIQKIGHIRRDGPFCCVIYRFFFRILLTLQRNKEILSWDSNPDALTTRSHGLKVQKIYIAYTLCSTQCTCLYIVSIV